MGRPLIAADVPGCREVVEHGVNGFLCEVKNAQSLAQAMGALIATTGEARATMGLAARKTVEERFSEERVVEAYLGALKALAAL